jgi:catalase-peroxidase
VFTQRAGQLSNDFFVNLLDMGTVWSPPSDAAEVFEGRDRKTGAVKWTGTRWTWCSAPTRSCARWPRSMPRPTRSAKFVRDFVAAWVKVMNLDRFDASATQRRHHRRVVTSA